MIPLRLARELTYPLEAAGEHERLLSVVSSIPVFFCLYRSEENSHLLSMLRMLDVNGQDIHTQYRATLQRLRKQSSTLWPDAVQEVSQLFESRADWTFARGLVSEFLDWAIGSSDKSYLKNAHLRMGNTYYRTGLHQRAKEEYSAALGIAQELGDLGVVSSAESNIGLILFSQGEHHEALGCFRKQLAIRELRKDRIGVARTYSRIGNILVLLGEFDEALACYNQTLTIAKSLSDRLEEAFATGNIGAALVYSGRYEEALPYLETQYRIAEELGARETMSKALFNSGAIYFRRGNLHAARANFEHHLEHARASDDKKGEALSLGNIGEILYEEGQYRRAIEMFHEKLALSEELGDKRGIAMARGSLGRILLRLHRHPEALPELQYAVDGHRESGSFELVADWLCEIGLAFLEIAEMDEQPEWIAEMISEIQRADKRWKDVALRRSRDSVEESLELSAKISHSTKRFAAKLLLTRIDAAEGKDKMAEDKLGVMLAEATGDEEQVAELHFWLWKIANNTLNYNEAVARFPALYARIPKFEFQKRIAELRGETIPMSADEG